MKVKGKELILKVVSLVATVLAFVGLALKFAYQKIVIKGLPKVVPDAFKSLLPSSESLTRKDWTNNFDTLKDFNIKSVGWWQASRVLLIVSLVILAIVAVISIVQFFFNHKILSVVKIVATVLGIVSVVAFVTTLLVGSALIADKISTIYTSLVSAGGLTGVKVTATYFPHVGAYFLSIFTLIALVTALFDRRKEN